MRDKKQFFVIFKGFLVVKNCLKPENAPLMGICRSSLLNQKHNVGWFPPKSFVDLLRICYLNIISRNHCNTLLLINLQKRRTCPK